MSVLTASNTALCVRLFSSKTIDTNLFIETAVIEGMATVGTKSNHHLRALLVAQYDIEANILNR